MSETTDSHLQDPTPGDPVDLTVDATTDVGEIPAEKPVEGSDEGDFTPISERDGVIIEKGDRSLFELFHWYTDGRLQIEPEWQRNYVWDIRRASR